MTTLLITGCSRGIGRRLAELYLDAGLDVIATARDPKTLEGLGGRHLALDVTDSASIANLVDALDGQPIDFLINNAGIFGPRGMQTGALDFAAWSDVLATNLIAPMAVSEALLPNLRGGERKVVATISSRMGSMSQSSGGEYIYRSSKAGLNGAMRAYALDLEEQGFSVTVLHPGWVRTDMGGGSATLSVDESAVPLSTTILGLTSAHNGMFLNFDGTVIGW